jgi:vitamin B12 transporter
VRTGTVAYGLDLTPSLRAAASAGTSFVAPSFNQLYFPGFGNPALLPEEGHHREWSLRWVQGGFTSRIAYVDNRIRGFITAGPRPVNLPRQRLEGVTASLQGRSGPWTLSASVDSLTRRPSNRAADVGRLGVDWDGGAWQLGSTWVAQGDRRDLFTGARLAGFGTLDLRAEWRVQPGLRLSVSLNNVTDKAYAMALGYNAPGREALVGLRWTGR